MIERDPLSTAPLRQETATFPTYPARSETLARSGTRALTDRLDSLTHLWSWNLRRIEAPQAWEITRGDPKIAVAIVDTGIDAEHPDLRGKVLRGVDVHSSQASWADDQGHGTAVAGVVASRGWRGKGLAGVAPACRLLSIKCNQPGTGNVRAEDIAAGVRAAIQAGSRILNLSVGVTAGEPFLTEETLADLRLAIREAIDSGAVVVCAAGPSGFYQPYPGLWSTEPGFEGLIAVGATTRTGEPSLAGASGDFVTVWAPADGILSTARGGGYAPFGATSAASPHVAGIAALLRSLRPDAAPDEIRDLIVSGARSGHANALASVKKLHRTP